MVINKVITVQYISINDISQKEQHMMCTYFISRYTNKILYRLKCINKSQKIGSEKIYNIDI